MSLTRPIVPLAGTPLARLTPPLTPPLPPGGFGELRAGNLGVRIATTAAERDAAQALRYRIFYDEMGAQPDERARRSKRDIDVFDDVADHLLVIDHAVSSGARGVVGTYRLVQNEGASRIGRFYTSDEYDISRITGFPGRLLELGRSCVDANYRGRAVMQLLWRGIAAYVFLHRIDVMFGCASLPGTDPDRLCNELTYLYHNHLAPPALRLRAVPERYIEMRRCDPARIDHRRAQLQLPPLIKGYLRLGGFIGDGAVIDAQFNTTDVAVVVKTDLITDKYYRHYERQLRDALGLTGRLAEPPLARFGDPMLRDRRSGLAGLGLLFGAGGLSALALPPLGLVGILLLTLPLLLSRIDAAANFRAALWRGFAFGFGLHCVGLYWLTDAILTRLDQFWWALPLATPLCALPLAIFTAVPCAACRAAPAGWPRVLLLAGLWTLSDLAREFAFTGFPWNPLGSAWEWPDAAGDVMIQSAAWIGVPGLTLLTLLMALLPTLGRRGPASSLLLLLLLAGFGASRLAWVHPGRAPGPTVVLVQGNIPEVEKLDHAWAVQTFRTYLRLTAEGVQRAAASRPAASATRGLVFAWPESAFPGLLDEDAEARRMIMAQAPGANVGLVGSVRFGSDGRPRNSLFMLRPGGSVAAVYDKAHLVPFGEYQPAGLPVQIVPGGGFSAGPGRRTLHPPGLAPFGPLICYEVIFPGRVFDRSDRPDWLLNITNDAWYGDSAGPRQHLAAARMRAVEEGLPLARAANTGISAAYDGFGHELARLGWGQAGSLVVAMPAALAPTPFARLGLALPLLLALAAAATGLASGLRRLPAARGQSIK